MRVFGGDGDQPHDAVIVRGDPVRDVIDVGGAVAGDVEPGREDGTELLGSEMTLMKVLQRLRRNLQGLQQRYELGGRVDETALQDASYVVVGDSGGA